MTLVEGLMNMDGCAATNQLFVPQKIEEYSNSTIPSDSHAPPRKTWRDRRADLFCDETPYEEDKDVFNITSLVHYDIRQASLEEKLLSICWQGQNEYLESGMDSRFSRRLKNRIVRDGVMAVFGLAYLILSHKVDDRVALYALTVLGDLEDPSTHEARYVTLKDCLDDYHSAWVRSGAIRGLSLLEDKRAISVLRQKMGQERHPRLRQDMEEVADELEDVSSCPIC